MSKNIYRKLWRCTSVWLKVHYLYKGFSAMRELVWIKDKMEGKDSPSARIIVRTIKEKLK